MTKYKHIKFDGKKSPYNPDWIMVRENCSREEAEIFIAKYKKNKATTLENFIRKYGEKEGKMRFENFQNASVSRKPEKFKSKEEYDFFNRSNSPRCPEFWLSRNLAKNIREARRMVSEYQLTNSGVHLKHYISRGYSQEEAIKLLMNINSKKIVKFKMITYKYLMNEKGLTPFDSYLITSLLKGRLFKDNAVLINNLNFSWYESFTKSEDKISFVINNLNTTLQILKQCVLKHSPLTIYRTIVLSLSNEHDLSDLDGYNEIDEYGRAYEMDHIYSIKDGFDNDIDPILIAKKCNLRFIPKQDNGKKWRYSAITLDELFERIANENNENTQS